MDPDVALHVLQEQNRLAREWLRAVAGEKQRKAEALANALRPWLNNTTQIESGLRGFLSGGDPQVTFRPEARRVVIEAGEWIAREDVLSPDLNRAQFTLRDLDRLLRLTRMGNLSGYRQHPIRVDDPVNYSFNFIEDRSVTQAKQLTANSEFGMLFKGLEGIARELRELPSRIYIWVPASRVRPPNYTRPVDSALASRFIADLTGKIDRCRDFASRITPGSPVSAVMRDWLAENIIDFLNHRFTPGPTHEFESLIREVRSVLVGDKGYGDRITGDDNPVIADAGALARAYLALAGDYLEGVRGLMQDYVAASSEVPQPQIKIEGGHFPGAQIGMTIANIQSTITGVVQTGDTETAKALKALTEAILYEEGLPSEERQDLLSQAQYLAAAAQEPPEQRNRGVLKSIFTMLNQAAERGPGIAEALNTWGTVIRQLIS